MKDTPLRLLVVLLPSLLMAATCASTAGAQGKLDAFEADANAPAEPSPRTDERDRQRFRKWESPHRDQCPRCLADTFCEMFSDIARFAFQYGGACSWARITAADLSAEELTPRALGEPLIPFARMDLSYQDVESDVDAFDIRVEGGYGPVAVQFDFTRYWERDPVDDLDLIRFLGVYRMSFGSHVETDVGLGVLTLDGEHTDSRFLFSVPILVHPSEHWGIELRPAWANRVSDYDVAALLTWRYASFKAGYRWVDTPHETMDGPYIGISLRL